MLTRVFSACVFAVLAIALSGTAHARQTAHNRQSTDDATSFDAALAGTWRSAPDEMVLSSDFDVSVWGKNAKSVRTVELQLDASGRGPLTVTRKVVDGRGRTVAASTSIERATVAVGGSHQVNPARIEHDVSVQNAVRTYADEPGSKWDMDGLRVQIATFPNDANTVEVRVEPPEGKGAFWETLRRDHAPVTKHQGRS
jgi:hypothetical protein